MRLGRLELWRMISSYACVNVESSERTGLSAKVSVDHKTVNSILLLSLLPNP